MCNHIMCGAENATMNMRIKFDLNTHCKIGEQYLS